MYKLEKGIFLEDNNVLLEWEKSIEKLVIENDAKIIKQADRIIIEWGKHKILGGLNLELSNTYLLSKLGIFNSIGFNTVGDDESFEYFSLISTHLEKVFGNPIEKEDNIETKNERFWAWQIGEVRISIYLFEQHAFKLHFKIEKM
jgi:hypothetical protein